MHSTYCFLLGAEEQRDGDTWALRLMECQDHGFAPDATIADFGTGIHSRPEACHARHAVSRPMSFMLATN